VSEIQFLKNVLYLTCISLHRTVCGVNTQLDRLQQQISSPQRLEATDLSNESLESIGQLHDLINSISVTSKTQSLLPPSRLADLLSGTLVQITLRGGNSAQLSDHVWIVVAKAAIQASGLVMNTLLDQTLQLHDETYYWGEMLGSVWYSSLYTVQKFPAQFCRWTKDACAAQIYQEAPSITARWSRFYQIARQTAWNLGGHSIGANLLSPVRSSRAEIRQKRDLLLKMKDLHTSSLGLLMEGWHLFEANDSASLSPGTINAQWCDAVHRAVVLIEAIFHHIALEPSTRELEQGVFATLERDMDDTRMHTQRDNPVHRPLDLIERLVRVLRGKLPNHTTSTSLFIRRHGRPSSIVRYWLPVSAVLLSGSASMRFLASRQEEIIQSIADIGTTTIDFWGNWVVHPIRNLIGTIRHDEKSEIAIMSKNSLLADRESLERMVVDFVRDRPDLHQGAVADTTAIVNSVKEGDLTPVLKAYERDLRSPFVGTVRGDLVRALLIQIQKTKVDVEIAISGIDALLKSQELVFGYVGASFQPDFFFH
jgi:nuclear-control-of-ATPase protein 2